MTNEEHGRDADKDGEEAPLGAVGHLEAETRTGGENPMIIHTRAIMNAARRETYS